METKHTPGPWHWVNPSDDNAISGSVVFGDLRTVEEFGDNKTEIIDGERYTRFRLPKFIIGYAEDVNEANARLIAAAPELLAALEIAEEFVAKFEDDEDYTDGQIETIHAIRAAIAKATGASHE